jgi:hypothetical protein
MLDQKPASNATLRLLHHILAKFQDLQCEQIELAGKRRFAVDEHVTGRLSNPGRPLPIERVEQKMQGDT